MTARNAPKTLGSTVRLGERVAFGTGVTVGHCSCIGISEEDRDSCIGISEEDRDSCRIGNNVHIGAFCAVSMGATLADCVKVDHYCRVGASEVGRGTRLLYGARVHDDAKIGSCCIIGGNVPDRTCIGDSVKHFGRMAHIPHRDKGWDDADDPAPIIGDNVFIGANALVVGGVRIGEGACIKAGAAVMGDGVTIGAGAKIEPMRLVQRDVPACATVNRNIA